MNLRMLLSCSAAFVLAATPARAQTPDPSPPPSPPARQQKDRPPGDRENQHAGPQGDAHARLGHLTEAIKQLRAGGFNEPAGNLEKMAHEMREHLERERRGSPDGKSPDKPGNAMREHRDGEHHDGDHRDSPDRDGRHSDSWRPPYGRPMWGGGPPMLFGRMDEMQKEIRSLSSQVQELRNLVKGRGGDQQQSARKPEGPRDGDHRDGSAGSPPRRPEGPPHPDQHARDGDGHRDGDHGGPPRGHQPDQPGNQPPHNDAKHDGPPGDGAMRNGPPPQNAPPREDAKRDGAPRDGTQRTGDPKEGARAESNSGSGRPSELERARFMGLSDKARDKFVQEMRESRDKMMNATPEERMKAAKELFDRVEAEDKAKKNESRAADDGLRALEVKPPL